MRRLQWLVWNRSERRLRAPWRLLVGTAFLFVATIVGLLVLGPVALFFGIEFFVGFGPTTQPLVVNAVLGVLLMVAIVPVGWFLDRRQLSDYGLALERQWLIDCGVGLLIGAGAMTALVAVGLTGGWIAVASVELSADALGLFGILVAVFVIVGIYEELLIRGYLLTNLAEGFRYFEALGHHTAVALATLLSSGVFGGLHLTNPNATLLSTAVISAAGIMLALGYLYTGQLAIPIGVHITWNIFQGLVYGLPVSGIELPVTLVATTTREPAVVSGGAFGPEAGLLGLFGVAVAATGILVYSRFQYGTVGIVPQVSLPELRDTASE